MAENKTLEHLPEVRAAVTVLSPEDREDIIQTARALAAQAAEERRW